MPAYAWGYNGFGQVGALSGPDSETFTSESTLLEGCDEVCAASWSQTVGSGGQQYLLWGYDPATDSCVSRKVLERDSIGASPVRSWLGKQHFLAIVGDDGHVREISGKRRRTRPDYALGAMSGSGKALLARRHESEASRALDDLDSIAPQKLQIKTLKEPLVFELWDSLEALFSSASSGPDSGPRRFEMSPLDKVVGIRAGADHFAVHVSRLSSEHDRGHDQIYTFGDNRYGQLGLPRTGKVYVDEPTLVPWSDPILEPAGSRVGGPVACGDNFTVIGTRRFGVIGFGIDDQGQLGSDIEEGPEGGQSLGDGPVLGLAGAVRVIPEAASRIVTALECGSSHSIAVFDGECRAVGSDRWGQCAGDGPGGQIEVPGLEAYMREKGVAARVRIACGRWHTVVSYNG